SVGDSLSDSDSGGCRVRRPVRNERRGRRARRDLCALGALCASYSPSLAKAVCMRQPLGLGLGFGLGRVSYRAAASLPLLGGLGGPPRRDPTSDSSSLALLALLAVNSWAGEPSSRATALLGGLGLVLGGYDLGEH